MDGRVILAGGALGLAAWAAVALARSRRRSGILAELARLRAHRRLAPAGAGAAWDLDLPGARGGATGENALDISRRINGTDLRLVALRSPVILFPGEPWQARDDRLVALFALSPAVAEFLDGADAASTTIVRRGEAGTLVLVPETA